MYRNISLCLSILLICGTAAADDVASADKAPPEAAASAAASSDAKDAGEKAHKAVAQKGTAKGDSAGAKVMAVAGSKVAAQPGGDVKMSGMSILGNEEAPKSLVIVPWKSSQMGDMPSVSKLLDSSTQPVDKDVFMRELAYYEIRATAQ